MILIPDIETVLILTPRTGTSSLRRAVMARYPNAMMIYRHMEADRVPHGYNRWRRVGVSRNPVDRLWSLYKFLQDFGLTGDYVGRYPEHAMVPRHPRPVRLFGDPVFPQAKRRIGLGGRGRGRRRALPVPGRPYGPPRRQEGRGRDARRRRVEAISRIERIGVMANRVLRHPRFRSAQAMDPIVYLPPARPFGSAAEAWLWANRTINARRKCRASNH